MLNCTETFISPSNRKRKWPLWPVWTLAFTSRPALGLALGDAHILRNAGGRVTEDIDSFLGHFAATDGHSRNRGLAPHRLWSANLWEWRLPSASEEGTGSWCWRPRLPTLPRYLRERPGGCCSLKGLTADSRRCHYLRSCLWCRYRIDHLSDLRNFICLWELISWWNKFFY